MFRKSSAPRHEIDGMFIPSTDTPTRAYIHSAGMDVWGKNSYKNADEYYAEVLETHNKDLQGIDYFVAVFWGFEDSKMLDLAGFAGTEPWEYVPGGKDTNPEGFALLIKDNEIIERNDSRYQKPNNMYPVSCSQGFLVYGAELALRQTTANLPEYLKKPPVWGIPLQKIV